MILSLDFHEERFSGPEDHYDMPHLWPARVIVMTLAASAAMQGRIWIAL